MARKPNYGFERNARAKAKAEKREAKREAKLALKAEKQAAASPSPSDDELPGVEVPVDDSEQPND